MKRVAPLLLLIALSIPAFARASDYSALMKARKFTDAEQLASSRLAQDPANAEALVAKVNAIIEGGKGGRFDEAARLAEQCVAAHPQLATCHLALGNALGAKAIANGIMSALAYAGTIRDAFKKALELDPHNVEARMALMSYYLQAPAIVGGGSGKARALTAQTAALDPAAAKVMQARLDVDDERFAAAEGAMLAMPVSSVDALADGQRDVLLAVGGAYMKTKRSADAERVLREAARRFPDSDAPLYSLARVQQEQGKHRDAIALFEQVLARTPGGGAWYRLGQSQQALGEKSKAVSAYERALAAGTLPKAARADTEAQLLALRQK
ncbi:tetratricopeptide repeat protein [Massilia sp. PWRC2]|uniref:tetratricopeptide repeat protein n=1 Tax=Massilia sp. PWRC2 TaxID=2804626 RepID=UPI003CF8FCAD